MDLEKHLQEPRAGYELHQSTFCDAGFFHSQFFVHLYYSTVICFYREQESRSKKNLHQQSTRNLCWRTLKIAFEE